MAGAPSYCDEYSRELRTHASDRIRMLDWISGDTLDELITNAMTLVPPLGHGRPFTRVARRRGRGAMPADRRCC